jgi:hypothetical protein
MRESIMKKTNIYTGYRYPVQIIRNANAVWFYHRFTLSFLWRFWAQTALGK